MHYSSLDKMCPQHLTNATSLQPILKDLEENSSCSQLFIVLKKEEVTNRDIIFHLNGVMVRLQNTIKQYQIPSFTHKCLDLHGHNMNYFCLIQKNKLSKVCLDFAYQITLRPTEVLV